ncbi:MAG: hypothetical protein B7Y95_24925, partial [Rhizobiales bacterium 32-66-11]
MDLERAIFKLAIAATDDAVNTADAEVTRIQQLINVRADDAIALVPRLAPGVNELRNRIKTAISGACATTLRLAHSTDPESAAKAGALMVSDCEPVLGAVAGDVAKMIDVGVAEGKKHASELEASVESKINILLFGMFGVVLAMLVLAVLITRVFIVKPIARQIKVMDDLSNANLQVTVPDADRKDEVGRIAQALEVFRQELVKAEEVRAEAARQELRNAERLKAEREAIAGDFESKMGSLANAFASSSREVSE